MDPHFFTAFFVTPCYTFLFVYFLIVKLICLFDFLSPSAILISEVVMKEMRDHGKQADP